MKTRIGITAGKFLPLCILIAAFLCLSGSAGAEERNKKDDGRKKEQVKLYGQAIFPAEGKIKMEEGTIEAWVSLDYSAGDMVLQDKSGVIPMTFFDLCENTGLDKDKNKKGASDDYAGDSAAMRIATSQGNKLISTLAFSCNLFRKEIGKDIISRGTGGRLDEYDWKESGWYFISISWKKTENGYDVVWHVNGKKKETVFGREETVMFPKTMKAHLIIIGSVNSARGSVEALRISEKARTEEEIEASMKNGLSKDKSTLFLFDASLLTAMKKIRQADFKKDTKVPDKGLFVGPYKTINGKYGKAVQFYE
ncbi:MAG TPA: hypothetical protein DET40_06915 [Lentisphaeria bacterium]|nr:MAG: hypothetical protein A2X45_07385 [Lentisphaerae bacterium GWF2_50_93]HCE43261.1 hypothetical protein [Lentisphaeria bacterium]